MVLDSSVYLTEDDARRPSNVPLYGMELLSGSQTSLPEAHAAIERLNRELARILGTEQLLLGSDSKGSYALSKDKTGQFYLLIDAGLTEVREAIDADLVDPIWMLNGWPEEMKPEMRTEAVRARDVEQIATTLRDMATAGAPILPDDPVVNQVRDWMGTERVPEDSDFAALLDGMAGDEPDDGGDVDLEEMPEEDE